MENPPAPTPDSAASDDPKNQGSSENTPSGPSQEIVKIINEVPQEQREEVLESVLEQIEIGGMVEFAKMTHFSGPFPPPEILQGFEDVVPGAAREILNMTLSQSRHRQECEKLVITHQQTQSRRGQIFGFILVILAVGTAAYLGKTGHDAVAGVIGGSTVIGVASIFALGRTFQKKNLDDKKDS
jgi:uncharacterized membrane protein